MTICIGLQLQYMELESIVSLTHNTHSLFAITQQVRAGDKALIVSRSLRDHTYAMLATRTFTKFKQAHLVKYKFNYVLNEENGFDPVPVVESPPVYSRRIQKTERGYHFPFK